MFRSREVCGDDDRSKASVTVNRDRERPSTPRRPGRRTGSAADEEGRALPDQDVAGGGVLPPQDVEGELRDRPAPFPEEGDHLERLTGDVAARAIVTFPPYFFPARR